MAISFKSLTLHQNIVILMKSLIELVQDRLTKRQFIFLSSVLVGLSAGIAVVVLKTFAHHIFRIATFDNGFNSRYLFVILPILGIFLTVLVTKKILKGRLEKGLPNIHYAIAKKSSIVPRKQMYAQVITSSLTVGLGGSAGLEAPIVITGAAFGSNYARSYHLNYKDRTLLLACGIAAGIAAAFNAPIAGVLFALEVLLLDVSISAFIPLIIAAASGTLISKIILNDDILITFKLAEPFDYINVPFYALLGVLAGLVAVLHSRIFHKVEGLFSRSKRKSYRNVIFGGVALGALIFIFPSLFGEGYESIKSLSLLRPQDILENSYFQEYKNNEWFVLSIVGILIFVKAIATGLTLGSGGNGGNFAPSLFVGAYLGFFFSRFTNLVSFINLPESNFTLVGMAGILSGLYHAPLTAIFLIAEITGGYTLIIPLMLVSSISFAISRYFEPFSMDTKKMATGGVIFTNDKDKNILTTINTSSIIETDYEKLYSNVSLGELVNVISSSKRNVFPVTDKLNNFLGVVLLDNIRETIFKRELYETLFVSDLMTTPSEIIDSDESMESVMQKFDATGAWNLPVVHENKFVGFINKNAVFTKYRSKLKSTVLE
jgi:chloride channel protein, CIC family